MLRSHSGQAAIILCRQPIRPIAISTNSTQFKCGATQWPFLSRLTLWQTVRWVHAGQCRSGTIACGHTAATQHRLNDDVHVHWRQRVLSVLQCVSSGTKKKKIALVVVHTCIDRNWFNLRIFFARRVADAAAAIHQINNPKKLKMLTPCCQRRRGERIFHIRTNRIE